MGKSILPTSTKGRDNILRTDRWLYDDDFKKKEEMMKDLRFLVIFAAFLMIPVLSHAAADVKGAKDHPILSRMSGAYITNYQESDFDAFDISNRKNSTIKKDRITVEGRKYTVDYELEKPIGQLNILRNHTRAVERIGGEVLKPDDSASASMVVSKNGKNVWIKVVAQCNPCSNYTLQILEEEEHVQQVTATDMLSSINKTGFVALYINFDTGKSEIKPESMPAIDQIASLLKSNQSLNVSVEGHTDNAGDLASNKILSERRAQAVKDAVAGKGIDPKRMSHAGRGQEMPIADNRTEEGRAKNRRVELVKK